MLLPLKNAFTVSQPHIYFYNNTERYINISSNDTRVNKEKVINRILTPYVYQIIRKVKVLNKCDSMNRDFIV